MEWDDLCERTGWSGRRDMDRLVSKATEHWKRPVFPQELLYYLLFPEDVRNGKVASGDKPSKECRNAFTNVLSRQSAPGFDVLKISIGEVINAYQKTLRNLGDAAVLKELEKLLGGRLKIACESTGFDKCSLNTSLFLYCTAGDLSRAQVPEEVKEALDRKAILALFFVFWLFKTDRDSYYADLKIDWRGAVRLQYLPRRASKTR